MARAALRLGVRDLAKLAHMSANTVTRFENGGSIYASTADSLQRALEGAGVRFVDDGAVLSTNAATMKTADEEQNEQVARHTRQQARQVFTEKLQDAIQGKNRVKSKPKHRE